MFSFQLKLTPNQVAIAARAIIVEQCLSKAALLGEVAEYLRCNGYPELTWEEFSQAVIEGVDSRLFDFDTSERLDVPKVTARGRFQAAFIYMRQPNNMPGFGPEAEVA